MSLDEELAELGVGVPGAATAEAKVTPAPTEPRPAELAEVGPATVHPAQAQWAKWRPAFAQAMEDGFYTIEGLEQLLFQNKVQFWPGKDAAIVTEIVTYAGGEKVLQALWMAGDLAEAIEMAPGLEAFGRLMGCASVLVEGRPGWTRMLKKIGFAHWSSTLRKAL